MGGSSFFSSHVPCNNFKQMRYYKIEEMAVSMGLTSGQIYRKIRNLRLVKGQDFIDANSKWTKTPWSGPSPRVYSEIIKDLISRFHESEVSGLSGQKV